MKRIVAFSDKHDEYSDDLIQIEDPAAFVPNRKDIVSIFDIKRDLNITGKVVKRTIYYDFVNDEVKIRIYLRLKKE
jgi:hypothetical protein